MEREILKYEEHEDGSYTKIEKLTQTPKDGFVLKNEPSMGHKGKEYVKGYSKRIVYETSNPKKIYKFLWIMLPLVLLLYFIFFALMLFLTEGNPYLRKRYVLIFSASIITVLFIFIKQLAVNYKKSKQ